MYLNLEPRIDRLAFEGQDAEDAFVNAAKRLAGDESLESFDAERELADRQRSLEPQAAAAKAG